MTSEKMQELTAKIDESIITLCAETDAAKQDATYRNWLTTMSRFYQYSFGNQLLIAVQCPIATRVAGFSKWLTFKRFVRKGERGIRILAPIVRKQDEAKASRLEGESCRVVGFRSVAVFDIAQTDGEALPAAPCHDAAEGGEALLPKLEAAVSAFGVRLAYKAITGAAQGLSKSGSIEIEQDQTTAAKCGTIAHELAHELLHKADRSQGKQQRELEAESVAFAVLTHYGMKPQSHFYLAAYAVTGEMLAASMQTISMTARKIIQQIDGQAVEEGAEDVGPEYLSLAA